MRKFIEHLVPPRLRRVKPLQPSERVRLLATVPDTDNCLRAVEDLLQQNLEQEFFVAIDPQRPDADRLRACEGLRVHYYALKQLESEREQARELARQA